MTAGVAGCGGSAARTIDVTMTSSSCQLAKSSFPAGKTAFKVDNTSGQEGEAYVYDGSGNKVDEVEGIADGTSRTLTVSLDAGRYQFACKPEGKDNRTPFTVTK
ncbi:MAG TPA: cupredoxin domain-containing protein [Mycobacteriales bacterium]|nr:cupredoxin domain-containing protein [Mycobacteriales bacterium]